MKPEGILDAFRNFGRSTKLLVWAMLVLGGALFVVCLVADLTRAEWIKSYSYIPNVLAGLTGFLIGVPFALVVLATLASQRDQKAAVDSVKAISQIAWNQYRDAVVTLCSSERIEALNACAQRIQEIHDETWQGINRYGSELTPEEFEQLITFVQNQSRIWGEALQSLMQQIGETSDLRLQWFAAVRDWNTLDQYVRLQRLESGLPWFHRELDSLLQERMVADRHPMRPFFEMHDGDYGHELGQPDDMASAFRRVGHLAQLGYSQDTFNRLREQTRAHFPTTRVEGYLMTTGRVAHQMGMLCAFVQQIDRSGWPANAPEDPPLAS
ncbi:MULTISPECIES: hypothetical protein [unclassified Mycolicibacterium]|uniref:hypothetical protein n=1 Tax=unclassified Mycolicibacterium TaxID=2636767 RepID=UPI0012DF9CCC|nr:MULTISPECIES: hypothetical protein [unclassified Mycolicibacterium]MUL85218.1 hypothetical protein [Mycolicibacterium sp. CBMA 329]MUL91185.1 hypothetical protein [Mycolicibacterium sp. CBMA 331]MUL98146.1 hypothetical protein [Mycolicibacterium sp. CBMA 334]MUM25754.1 hypothetical protein [Mycolicibacterium sp. CBMA 295]MUM40944.1 hypothetical protein [Mycolicibacterium sp. CBMA 247]